MNALTDGERLVALETKMDNVLDNQKQQSKDFKTLNEKLDTLLPTYATIEQLEKLKSKSSLQTWLTGTLAAIFGSVITFLVMHFITTIGGKS